MNELIKCAMCGEKFEEDSMHDVDEGKVCNECFEDCYFTCSKCGWDLHLDRLTPHAEPEDNICCDCYEFTGDE